MTDEKTTRNPIAVQLYTVRNDCAHNFAQTLESIATIGYRAVELAGLHGLEPAELQRLLADNGLRAAAGHAMFDDLQQNFEKVLETYSGTLACRHLVIPVPPRERTHTSEDWMRFANQMHEMSLRCRERGVTLCYHNHAFEFDVLPDGRIPFDILFHDNEHPPAAELDVYWVTFGGRDPVTELLRLPGRCPLVHVKDMANTPERSFAEVGEGILDWKGIFAAAKKAGTEWLIVEQDECSRPPMDSIRISFENLKRMGLE